MGLLRTLLTVGLLPIGAVGAYRLARPVGSRYAQVAALLVYVANPLAVRRPGAGRWGVLALYAAAPTLVGLLARASGLAPVRTRSTAPPGRCLRARTTRQLILVVGVVTALVAMVLPVGGADRPRDRPGAGAGLARRRTRPAATSRMIGVALGGCGGRRAAPPAVEPRLPAARARSASALTGLQAPDRGADLASLLRFQVGPLGGAPLGYALLVAAALPLLIGQGQRHAWAVRGWALALASWGLAWASQQDVLPVALPAPEVLLVPAAIGLALATAMGVAAFQEDLPGYRFGWRQIASGLAAAAVVAVACLPVLGAAFDGRWSMPAGDHSRALSFIDQQHQGAPFRVLWLGDPSALPLAGWRLADGVAYATTDGGTPRLEDLLVGLRRRGHRVAGRRRRPGPHRPDRPPRPPARARWASATSCCPSASPRTPSAPRPGPRRPGFKARLDAQLDLQPIDVPAGLVRLPQRGVRAGPGVGAGGGRDPDRRGDRGCRGPRPVTTWRRCCPRPAATFGGRARCPRTATSTSRSAHSDGWQLRVAGHTDPGREALRVGDGLPGVERGPGHPALPDPADPVPAAAGRAGRLARRAAGAAAHPARRAGRSGRRAPTRSRGGRDGRPPRPVPPHLAHRPGRSARRRRRLRHGPHPRAAADGAAGPGRRRHPRGRSRGLPVVHLVLCRRHGRRQRLRRPRRAHGEPERPEPHGHHHRAHRSDRPGAGAPGRDLVDDSRARRRPRPAPAPPRPRRGHRRRRRACRCPPTAGCPTGWAASSAASWPAPSSRSTAAQIAVEHEITGPLGKATAPCSSTTAATWSFPWGVTGARGPRAARVHEPLPGRRHRRRLLRHRRGRARHRPASAASSCRVAASWAPTSTRTSPGRTRCRPR